MASDEDYMAFLDKANRDADEGKALAQQQQQQGAGPGVRGFKALDSDAGEVPKAIREVCASEVYESEADEPFEEVALRYGGGELPSEGE